jgi:replication factor C large subunit
MFAQKYKPKNLKEFMNQKEAVKIFLDWMEKPKKGKALLFYGSPGVGKSALAEAYASEKNLELIGMNASDYRSAKQIKAVIGKSISQQTLFKRGKVFFIDEIDGLVGRGDSGGVGELIDVIKQSSYPIILAANNPYEPRLRTLLRYCQPIKFSKISVWDIEKRLKEICSHEKISYGGDVLRQLSRMSDGDLRSAINDLWIISAGNGELSSENLNELSSRERERNIFDALKIIFKTKSALGAKLALNNVDKDPDEIFWWIENNIANEYEAPEELANAYDALSRADLFKQRISYRQNWRLLSYMIDAMTAGVAVAKKEAYRKFVKYQYPNNFQILGMTKQTRKDSSGLNKRFASHFHCSSKKFKSQILPYLKIILKNKQLKHKFLSGFAIEEGDLKLLFS